MLTLPCVYTVASLVVPSEVVWPLYSLVAACRDFGHATETLSQSASRALFRGR